MKKHMGGAGQLKILVVKGVGLPAADIGGTSDPFVQIQVGHDYGWNPKVWKTSKLKKTLNPIWNEEFIVPVASPEKDGVRFACFDYDFIGSNDLLGQAIFPNLHKLPLGVPTDAVLQLAGLNSSRGTLHVVLTALNFGVQGATVIQTTTQSPAPVAVQQVTQVQQPVQQVTQVQQTTAYNPYGAPPQQPYGAPAPAPYGAPAGSPYGAPPAQQQPYQVPNMYGAPSYPAANSYQQPQQPYGAPPAANPYGAPAANPYGAPPPQQQPYGAPPPQANPYGAPAQQPYGAPTGQNPYGQPGY